LTANSHNKSSRLSVKVTPNAGRSEITGLTGGVLQVKIAAPPVKGRANKELIEFLGKALGVKKSSLAIVKGQTSRNKVIGIEGITSEEIVRRLTD
jgi:uncharacterized protein (TIGR00251 family)